MTVRKRCLLWDWTNTAADQGVPWAMDNVDFKGPICSVSNWNTWEPPELKGRAPFRPMVRDESLLSGDEWQRIESSGQPIIHFFNEPERRGISPEKGAEIWNQKMMPLRSQHGKKLVSPSCASDPSGTEWINKWMDLVSHAPPDYLGLHWYGTSGDIMISYLEGMHQKYPNIPIYVSEWASVHREHSEVTAMTAQVANWMDERDWIFEYGLFGCMKHVADDFVSPAAQLMESDGSFTKLMKKYISEQPMRD
ncbi:hypothetical protein MBLNU459_g3318t1 [Dothideomycetes sp. NU459]